MVGTPKNIVLSGAAPRIAGTSKRSRSTADAPAASVPNKPAQRPCTWKSGRHRMRRSVGLPGPGGAQRRGARQEGCVGVDRTLRLSGGARRVDDERVVAGLQLGEGDGPRSLRLELQLLHPQHGDAGTEHTSPVVVADGDAWAGVAHHVRHLGGTGRRAERHQHRAGPQHRQKGLDGRQRRACAPQHPIARTDVVGGERGRQPRRVSVQRGAVDDPRSGPTRPGAPECPDERPTARPTPRGASVPAPEEDRRRQLPRGHSCPHDHRRHLIVWRS